MFGLRLDFCRFSEGNVVSSLRGFPLVGYRGRSRHALAIFGCVLIAAVSLNGSASAAPIYLARAVPVGISTDSAFAGSVAAGVCNGTGGAYDFQRGSRRDVAIADPGANDGAGRIIVQYEGINTTQVLDPAVAGNNKFGAQAGDQFGYSMDIVDWDSDGCTDLLVGVPFEDLASGGRDHGMVHLIYGSPDGLGKGKVSENWTQDSDAAGFGDVAESRDNFGFSVAASRTAANQRTS